MIIVFSRKGFDSQYGGFPSPILPDGKMTSIPIHEETNQSVRYEQLYYGPSANEKLVDLLIDLRSSAKYTGKYKCKKNGKWDWCSFKDGYVHVDPDLRRETLRNRPTGWRPLFGQVGASQAHLSEKGISEGDIFLFFGWFRKTEKTNGKLEFCGKNSKGINDDWSKGKHVIFGYLQVDKIIIPSQQQEERQKEEWMDYFPHFSGQYIEKWEKNNAIYAARSKLDFCNKPGAGIFKYNEKLVLSKKGYSRSCWELPSFFKDKITYVKWDEKKGCFQSPGKGQEFVVKKNEPEAECWTKELIRNSAVL